MSKKHKNYKPEFKARIVIELLESGEPLSKIASK
jgi:transposase-like protein